MSDPHNNDGHYSTAATDSEPLIPFDVREQNGRRSIYILFGMIFALLAFALFMFFAYQPGTRDRADAPRVSAENAPFKVEPENPGGMQTPNQDKTIYNKIEGTETVEAVQPAPGPEAPLMLPKSANIQVDAPQPVVETPGLQIPTEPKPTAQKPVVTKPAVTTPKPAPAVSGDYVVQVASVRNRSDAVALWGTVSTKFASNLPSGTYSDIKQVDLADKGIYYRLRVAGLRDQDAAKRLCDQFKARGQACFVTRQ